MKVRAEVIPFLVAALMAALMCSVCLCLLGVTLLYAATTGVAVLLILSGYFLYFFRDPDRSPPDDMSTVVAGADGRIADIVELHEERYLKVDCVRISIFLSLFDVHVNRAPISGKSQFLGYFKGRHLFTFQPKSSDVNQHNKLLIEGAGTRCLITQIVGPVCRRVVYWLDHDNAVWVSKGERLGMMKFGSRLDMYFPKSDVTILCKKGEVVRAGETIIARVCEPVHSNQIKHDKE